MTTSKPDTGIDVSKLKLSADYVRYLSLECIQRANSGHPGLPLGCAELGVMLYRYILNYHPLNADWVNRDRFILSAGHGSMLLYSLLYMTGYPIGPEDLGRFRQLESLTPGHPEYDITFGIETTTGPLGQGLANTVGCALEGKILGQKFNETDITLFDYTVYVLTGDGCNMEGISYEAASIAGHLGLDNLVAIYDSNSISIDGSTGITFTEDVKKRYEAQGWHVENADITAVQDVFQKLKTLKTMRAGKPKLLILKTTIGEGIKEKRGKASIHGAPAGIDEIVYFIRNSRVKKLFENEFGSDVTVDDEKLAAAIEERLAADKPLVDPDVNAFMKERSCETGALCEEWEQKFREYKEKYPEKCENLSLFLDFDLPKELENKLLNYQEEKPDATRSISGRILNLCAGYIPQMVGGVADLAGSTKAVIKEAGQKGTAYIQKDDYANRNIAFGVREHGMGAIGNGLALNKSLIPFTSTFFTFFDYMKPAVRLAALMRLNHLFVFSHDSIYVGEDGPTHQPIEHLNALRLIPDIYTFRPANDVETAFSYLYFLQETEGPVALVTSRQKMAAAAYREITGPGRNAAYNQFKNGAYVFYDSDVSKKPEVILCASGSELGIALETAKLLEKNDSLNVRVVSMPCMELFAEGALSDREKVLIPGVPVALIEAASHRAVRLFYGSRVILVDIQAFGKSAPGSTVGEEYGFSAEKTYRRIIEEL